MKRTFLAFVTVLLVFACAVGVGCHTCEFSQDWTSDATNHWHACVGEDCTEKSDVATHTYENGACTVCEYTHTEHTNENGVCNVCGAVDHSYYQVSDEDWANLFKVTGNLTQTSLQTLADGSTYAMVGKIASNGMHTFAIQKDAQGNVQFSYETYMEFDEDNDIVYRYIGSDDSGWQKEEYISLTNYRANSSIIRGEMANKENYTYNSATKAYEASSIVEGVEPYTVTYTNLSMKIVDGKLVSFVYSGTEEGQAYTDVSTYTYGDAVVELPAIQVNRQISSEQEWNAAMNFQTRDSVHATLTSDSIAYDATMKISEQTDNSTSRIIYYEVPLGLDLMDGYFEVGQAGIFSYSEYNNVYIGSDAEEQDVLDVLQTMMFTFEMSSFEYADGKYYAESISAGYVTFIDVYITFADGRLEKVEYSMATPGGSASAEVNYVYGSVDVELPADSFRVALSDINDSNVFTKSVYVKNAGQEEYLQCRLSRKLGMQVYDDFSMVATEKRYLWVLSEGVGYYGSATKDASSPSWGTMDLMQINSTQFVDSWNQGPAGVVVDEINMPTLSNHLSFDAGYYTDVNGTKFKIANGKVVELIYIQGGSTQIRVVIDYSEPVIDQQYTID